MKKLFLFLLLGIFLINIMSVYAFNWSSTTAYYSLDETTGTSVRNQNLNTTLNLTTDMTMGVSGKLNTAFLSNGVRNSMNFTTGQLSTTFFDNNFSISLWFNAKDTDAADILFWAGTRDIALQFNGTAIDANFYNGTSYDAYSSPVSLNTWYHVVLVRSKTEGFKIYLNGQLNGTNSFIGNTTTTNTFSQIGNRAGVTNSFNGTLDEIGIFGNRILSQSEILELYNGGMVLPYNNSLIITQISPEDNHIIYETNVTNVLLSCNVSILSGGGILSNVTIYQNSTGTWQSTTTNLSSQSLTSYSFNQSISLGSSINNVSWFCSTTNNNSQTSYTNNRTIQVNPIIFTICNSTYQTKFLNISFKDENNMSNIYASIPTSTFEYYLGNGSVTKTYTYVNNTESPYFTFCASPNLTFYVNPYVQYKKGTDYPQRIWDEGASTYTNTTTNKILYLLSSIDGIYVTYQILNPSDQPVSNVVSSMIRVINGENVTVGTQTSGADGLVTFWANPDFFAYVLFSKTGFNNYTLYHQPTQTSYTIAFGTNNQASDDYTKGVKLYFTPKENELVNDTVYSFTFNLTSSYWDVEEFGFSLRLANGTILGNYTSSTSGTASSVSYNTSNQSIIYMDYYWIINSHVLTGKKYWIVTNSELTGWSLKTLVTDFKAYLVSGIFGLDEFGENMIVFIILFLAVGIMSYKFGYTSPMAVTSMIFAIVFFFDIIIGVIPPIRNIEHLLTYIAGILLIGATIREVSI